MDGGLSYYAVLGVARGASAAEIRAAYLKLVMKWHPDKLGRDPRAAEESKSRFHQIQEAYQVLADASKRGLYDAGIYDLTAGDDEDGEGFSNDFIQEMLSMMDKAKRQPAPTMSDLRAMLSEMSRGFGGQPQQPAQPPKQSSPSHSQPAAQ